MSANDYIMEWQKKNMKRVSVQYKKEFVEEFKKACDFFGVKQSQLIKEMMQETIDKAKKEGME